MEVGSDNNCEDNSISFDINEKVSPLISGFESKVN